MFIDLPVQIAFNKEKTILKKIFRYVCEKSVEQLPFVSILALYLGATENSKG